MNDPIYDQAAREWEEEPSQDDDKCEDCGQRKCICVELDEL